MSIDGYVLHTYNSGVVKKLTITVSEDVYNGLHAKIGTGRISRFIDNLARPHVVDEDLIANYQAMTQDKDREAAATQWTENLVREHF